jgi:hypothetical protein
VFRAYMAVAKPDCLLFAVTKDIIDSLSVKLPLIHKTPDCKVNSIVRMYRQELCPIFNIRC